MPLTDPNYNEARACRDANLDRFFDESAGNIQWVRVNYCSTCPILRECETWSIANFPDIQFGIFAGWSSDQRHDQFTHRRYYTPWYTAPYTQTGYVSRGRKVRALVEETKPVALVSTVRVKFGTRRSV